MELHVGLSFPLYCLDDEGNEVLIPREARVKWKDVLRADPCVYCGQRPAGTIDHIQARGARGFNSTVMNGSGCCARCNNIKRRSTPLIFMLEREERDQRHSNRLKSFFTAEQIEQMRKAV